MEQLLEELVAQSSDGVTIFFSSHQIADVERIADHVCILEKGQLVVDAPMDEIRQSYRQIRMVFEAMPPEHEFQIPGVEAVRTAGHQMTVFASCNAEGVIERARDFQATSIETAPVGLRDVFLQTVREG